METKLKMYYGYFFSWLKYFIFEVIPVKIKGLFYCKKLVQAMSQSGHKYFCESLFKRLYLLTLLTFYVLEIVIFVRKYEYLFATAQKENSYSLLGKNSNIQSQIISFGRCHKQNNVYDI